MKRISVVGTSGSGKTTLARVMSQRLGIPHVELDAIYHQPNWTHLEDDEFVAAVEAVLAGESWIVDGNYSSTPVQALVWDVADTVVWLDLPRSVVTWRVLTRSVTRAATGRELWAGNKERWANLFKWDPKENIVRWSWTHFDSNRAKYSVSLSDPRWSHIDFIHLRSRSEVHRFVDRLHPRPRASDR